jgi:hypothetical protein
MEGCPRGETQAQKRGASRDKHACEQTVRAFGRRKGIKDVL